VRKKKCFLELVLKDEIVEGQPEYSIFSRKARTALQDIADTLRRAARDPGVIALSLTLEHMAAGWAQLSELRRAVTIFRKSGKPVFCHLQEGGNAEYYLASACDRIFMPSSSSLRLVGLAIEIFFFREIMNGFGIEAQLHSVGEYKSAAEIFTRTGMSEPAREQLEALLSDAYEELCGALESRGFSREEANARINAGPYSAREALQQKLIDGIGYQDEVADKIKERFPKKVFPIAVNKYARGEGFFKRVFTFRRPRIALIDVQGYIDSGESRRGRAGRYVTGSDTIGRFLDHARTARRVRAVILRIDSPGGSGLASDLIWRKISLLGKTKPVVVSFGNVAASGGYYIAAPAHRILAEPNSITGSIGVLAGKVVAQELMTRLSIHRESVRRGEHAEYESPFKGFSPTEQEILNRQMEEFYREDFLTKVADGRKSTREKIDEVGRGRVWSGKRARELNLVDEIGGIWEAIDQARRLAKIPASRKTRVVHYYRHRRFWERFVPDFHTQAAIEILPRPALECMEILESFGGQEFLLLLPFTIRIR
jgi:protease IV